MVRSSFTQEATSIPAGPFEIWDMLGVASTVEKMETAGIEVASWVKEMLAAGFDTFYSNGSYYDFEAKTYQPTPIDSKMVTIDHLRVVDIAEPEGYFLCDMGGVP